MYINFREKNRNYSVTSDIKENDLNCNYKMLG